MSITEVIGDTVSDAIDDVCDAVDLPWIMTQRWEHLLFCSWRYPADCIAALLPDGLVPDEHDGSAWVSAVPLHVANLHLRDVPAIPNLEHFDELNLRTYVRRDNDPGDRAVWFFSIDVANEVSAWIGRHVFHAPYHHANVVMAGRGPFEFSSHRDGDARFDVTFEPSGPVKRSQAPLTRFLTERYRMYVETHDGYLRRGDLEHPKWELFEATAQIFESSVLATAGLTRPADDPVVWYSPGTEAQIKPMVAS